MRVKEIMTVNAKACKPTTNLAEVASAMWERDCGILPVVAEGGKVVGLITDRDMCMAAAMKNRHLSNIAVEEVITGKVYACRPSDDVHLALRTMQEHKTRRLPVVDDDGTLAGILSMNDIVLKAEEGKDTKVPELSYGDVVSTFKAICSHPLSLQQQSKQMAAGV
jgi:CBS domain-containing protein